MTFEKSKNIFDQINITKLEKLKNELLEAAFRYSRIRADWYLMDTEERKNNEGARTTAHNAFIDCCNILSREMIKVNEDAGWRQELTNDRKEIGDFACYLQAIIGLVNR